MRGKLLHMKEVCYIIFITTTLALRSFGVLPTAAYSYQFGMLETFDSMGTSTSAPKLNGVPLWSVEPKAGEDDHSQKLKVPSDRMSGNTHDGFNAGAVGNTDRSLGLGKDKTGCFTTKFVNNTGSKLTEIELYYDMECNWVSKGKIVDKLFGQISTNGTTWISLPQLDCAVSNSSPTITTDTWLTDAQMDAQKLSKRNIGGIIPLPATLPSIAVGQNFYIRWVTDSDNTRDTMTYGIDNLRAGPKDSDRDGMPDVWENANGLNPTNSLDALLDADNDGLTNLQEYQRGTNPRLADTDGDGLTDGQEVTLGTNPLSADSDADGMPDGWEATNGLNPLVNDASADADSDGLTNLQEYQRGTNPKLADTDGDGMSDGDEIAYGTNPLDSTSFFVAQLNIVPSPAPSGIGTNTVSFPAASGKYFTLLFSTNMTSIFTPVPGCVRQTKQTGEIISLSQQAMDGDIGFYKILVEDK